MCCFAVASLLHLDRDKNGPYLADDIFKRIFLNEKVIFLFKFAMGPVNNKSALVGIRQQAIVWSSDDLSYWPINALLGLNELSFLR